MLTRTAYGDSRLSFWLCVREFALPPSMIETATARRHAGDRAGACAAAGIEVDLDLRSFPDYEIALGCACRTAGAASRVRPRVAGYGLNRRHLWSRRKVGISSRVG